jgi:hypothetical protein
LLQLNFKTLVTIRCRFLFLVTGRSCLNRPGTCPSPHRVFAQDFLRFPLPTPMARAGARFPMSSLDFMVYAAGSVATVADLAQDPFRLCAQDPLIFGPVESSLDLFFMNFACAWIFPPLGFRFRRCSPWSCSGAVGSKGSSFFSFYHALVVVFYPNPLARIIHGNVQLIVIPTIPIKILACIPIDRIRNRYNMHQGHLPSNLTCGFSRSSKSIS